MLPSLDVGCTIRTFAVTNGHVYDFLVQFGCPEQKIKITERIEIAKIRTIGGNPLVIRFPKHLGSAQGVFDRLAQKP